MEVNNILAADYLDILFKGRNKQYGAYALRRQYQYSAMRSVGIILLIAVIISAIGMRNKTEIASIANADPGVVEMTDLSNRILPPPPPPAPPEPVAPAPPQNIATQKFDIPKIVDDRTVVPDDVLPNVTDLRDKAISDATREGDKTTSDMAVSSTTKTGSGGGGGDDLAGSGVSAPKIETYVEQMPAFDGSLPDYMQRNLRYPERARDNGIRGKVIVKFVVAEDGSVVDAAVLKGIGGGCDEEALRVVNRMPRWKPGKQNGRPVKVYHTLPIVFKLNG